MIGERGGCVGGDGGGGGHANGDGEIRDDRPSTRGYQHTRNGLRLRPMQVSHS